MHWLSRMSTMIFHKPIDMVVRHFENRLLELAMAVIFFGSSILLVFSPASARAGGLIYLSATFNVWTLTVIFFMVGVSRIVALGLNGHWMPQGAYVRAAGCGVGAIMWLQVDAALITFGARDGTLPFSTVTYGVLAVFEAISMYRALLGAKRDGRRKSTDEGNLGLGDRQHTVVAFYPASELDRLHSGDSHVVPALDQRPARAAFGR